VNRESEPGDESWPENRPRRNNIDADMATADSEVAGVNLDSLSDLGAGVPVETSESASARLAVLVRRALQENALTTGQDIDVEVVNGIARLHGRVAYLEDAEAAAAPSPETAFDHVYANTRMPNFRDALYQ